MATESPLRMRSHKEGTFALPTQVEDLGLLKKGQRFQSSARDAVPNRSGSAPPSMEGSLLSLISQQHPSIGTSLGSLSDVVPNIESESPSYLAYSKVNVNARLPTPPIPRRNQHLEHQFGKFSRNPELVSIGNCSNDSLHLSQLTLSTHKEESEDDRSPRKQFYNMIGGKSGLWPADDAASLLVQSKSLVDLIQEDFPRTPSPIYNHSQSLSSGTADEGSGHEADSSSFHDTHVTSPNAITSTLGSTQSTPPSHMENLNSSELTVIESEMKGLSISRLSNPDELQSQEVWQDSYQSTMSQTRGHQQGNLFQVQNAKPQVDPQVVNSSYIGIDPFPSGPSNFAAEVQPVLQSSGFTPPLYATAAAYISSPNPFYQNLPASGIYPPQYGGGYAVNSTVIPPFFAGYTPTIPMAFDGPIGSNFTPRLSGASTAASAAHGVEIQQFNKFYGQLGYTVQPPFTDPMYMQYYQQQYGPICNTSAQLDQSPSGRSAIRNQSNGLNSKTRSEATSDDHKLPHNIGGLINLNQFRGGTTSSHYFGDLPNMGVFMQYSSSPLANPSLQGSSAGGTGISAGRNAIRFPTDAGRFRAAFPGWQGQRVPENFSDSTIYNFLEELKSGKGRRFQLSDITGHVVEFSADQHGSRFIQQKLESCSAEEKASVFKEVLPYASKLMTDVFGNYVIQKFFEYGSPEQRKELANQLSGQILPLSLQMYGCRVIQKALEVIESDQKAKLVRELDGHIMRCVRDQNGNHVIQKCIESVPTEHIAFVISAFHGQVATLSKHPYGCRVIQRVLEHCADELQCQFIVDEILESVYDLAQDQYGNYVTQHVLERGKANERCQIINKLSGHIVQLSQHKFASNVVEKCLEYGGTTERDIIVEEILSLSEGSDNLLTMMKDQFGNYVVQNQFANYVVQKVLDTCTDTQRTMLLDRIKAHAHALKKYTYGKHIVARFELQFGEDVQQP